MTQQPVPSTELLNIAPKAKHGIGARILSNRPLVFGGLIVLLVFACAFLIPLIVGLDPYAVDSAKRLQPASADHFFGTDTFGRDLFARILVGASTSLIVGTSVAVLSSILGTAIGVLASFFPRLDMVLMRICDGLMSIPAMLLAVALSASLGPSVPNLIIALTVVFTPNVARLVRSKAMSVKSEVFVEASLAQGATPIHIMIRHILPNTLSVLAVQSTFIFADSIITEAALSFLGAGVPTPAPSWGNILYDGKAVILQAPHMVILGSVTLIITVIGLNLLGDGLRDLVDRRSVAASPGGVIARLFGTAKTTNRKNGASE
ncbi:MAG: ABC transporter permease [Microbacteriaceae bacterium]